MSWAVSRAVVWVMVIVSVWDTVPQCVRRLITPMKMKTRAVSRGWFTIKRRHSVSVCRRPARTYCCSRRWSRWIWAFRHCGHVGRRRICDVCLSVCLSQDQFAEVLDSMFEVLVKPHECIINQGDDGDNFYVIERWDDPLLPQTSRSSWRWYPSVSLQGCVWYPDSEGRRQPLCG